MGTPIQARACMGRTRAEPGERPMPASGSDFLCLPKATHVSDAFTPRLAFCLLLSCLQTFTRSSGPATWQQPHLFLFSSYECELFGTHKAKRTVTAHGSRPSRGCGSSARARWPCPNGRGCGVARLASFHALLAQAPAFWCPGRSLQETTSSAT